MRGCGGQAVKSDRPAGAPLSTTSNLLCRGSWGGRHRCGDTRDRAAAIVVAVPEIEWPRRPRIGWHRILARRCVAALVRAGIRSHARDRQVGDRWGIPQSTEVTDAPLKVAVGSDFTVTAASAIEDVTAKASSAVTISHRDFLIMVPFGRDRRFGASTGSAPALRQHGCRGGADNACRPEDAEVTVRAAESTSSTLGKSPSVASYPCGVRKYDLAANGPDLDGGRVYAPHRLAVSQVACHTARDPPVNSRTARWSSWQVQRGRNVFLALDDRRAKSGHRPGWSALR